MMMLPLLVLWFLVALSQGMNAPNGRGINLRSPSNRTIKMKFISSESNLTNSGSLGRNGNIRPPTGQDGFVVSRDTDSWARGIVLAEFANLAESNVFEFTFENNNVFGNFQGSIYRLPDDYVCSSNKKACDFSVQSNIETVSSFNEVIHQSESSNRYGFERSVEFKADVKAGEVGVGVKGTIETMLMFGNSEISKDYSSQSIEKTQGNVIGFMNQWSYECFPDNYKIKLDKNFIIEVGKLLKEKSLSMEKVKAFVTRFGSHIFKKMMTGKYFYRSLYFSETAEKSYKSQLEEKSKNQKFDYLGLQYGSNESSFDQEQKTDNFKKQVSFTKSGCVGATSCDMQQACVNKDESSSIIDYQLAPISALFSRVVPNVGGSKIKLFNAMVKNYTKELLYATKPCLAVGCSGDDVCTKNGSCMATTNKPVTKSYKDCDPETYQKILGNDPLDQLNLFHERIQDVCPRNSIYGYDGCAYYNVKHGMTNNACWAKVQSNQDAPMLRGVPTPVLQCFAPNIYLYEGRSDYLQLLEYYLWYGVYWHDSYSWFRSFNSNKDLAECLDKATWVEMEKQYKFYTPELK